MWRRITCWIRRPDRKQCRSAGVARVGLRDAGSAGGCLGDTLNGGRVEVFPRTTPNPREHLARNDLKAYIERQRVRPPGASVACAADAQDGRNLLSAGGASEPPLPADDNRAVVRLAAPFATRLLPNPPIAHAPSTRRRAIGKHRRGVTLSGREDLNLRPFGPESEEGPSQGDESVTNPATSLHTDTSPQSSESQPLARFSKDFATHLLPNAAGTFLGRWRAGRGGGARGPACAEDATAAQCGAHARRPSDPLGRARSAAQGRRSRGAPGRVQRDRLPAVR